MDSISLRLLIIANDALTRAGLVALFADQPGFQIVGQTTAEADVWETLDLVRPDVILCDLGWNAAPVLEQISDLGEAEIPVVLLLADEADVAAAWASGARTLLPRDATVEQLQISLQAAVEGLSTLAPEYITSLMPSVQSSSAQLVENLTPRETEVLHLLAEGLSNKGIARKLEISEHTVKFHVNAIMSKLGAQSRTEAVVRATQLGLILL